MAPFLGGRGRGGRDAYVFVGDPCSKRSNNNNNNDPFTPVFEVDIDYRGTGGRMQAKGTRDAKVIDLSY